MKISKEKTSVENDLDRILEAVGPQHPVVRKQIREVLVGWENAFEIIKGTCRNLTERNIPLKAENERLREALKFCKSHLVTMLHGEPGFLDNIRGLVQSDVELAEKALEVK